MTRLEVGLTMQKIGYSMDDETFSKIKSYMDVLEREFIRLYDIEERYRRTQGDKYENVAD